MRRVLVDDGRRHRAERHGDDLQKTGLEDHDPAIHNDLTKLLVLNEALERLAKLNPRQAQVVELHSLGWID